MKLIACVSFHCRLHLEFVCFRLRTTDYPLVSCQQSGLLCVWTLNVHSVIKDFSLAWSRVNTIISNEGIVNYNTCLYGVQEAYC